MRRGQRGWDVAALQHLLRRRGYSASAVDGVFGPGTHASVVAFQRAAGLSVDGLVGPATVSALRRGTSRRTTPVSSPADPVRFFRPVPGPIGDRFGARRRGGRRHAGLDFPAVQGTLVQASGVGTTIFAGHNNAGYGNLVVVQHRLGYTTWYAHLSQTTSWVGEQVTGGTRIGYVGSTGYSTGPHLHWEVRKWNTPLDPIPYLLPGTAARRLPPLRCREPAAYRTARIDDCR